VWEKAEGMQARRGRVRGRQGCIQRHGGRGRNRKAGRQAARQRGVGKQKQAGRGRHEVRYASNH
jgi:hypothetical protein